MREGSLVALATPEELMRRATGSVWELVVTSEEFDGLRRTMPISSAVRKADGVHARIVAAAPPVPQARAAEPNLEDAFLFTMKNVAAPQAARAVA
jgi:hypothetical protein